MIRCDAHLILTQLQPLLFCFALPLPLLAFSLFFLVELLRQDISRRSRSRGLITVAVRNISRHFEQKRNSSISLVNVRC